MKKNMSRDIKEKFSILQTKKDSQGASGSNTEDKQPIPIKEPESQEQNTVRTIKKINNNGLPQNISTKNRTDNRSQEQNGQDNENNVNDQGTPRRTQPTQPQNC